MPSFVHLHLHSEFSLLDGMCRVEKAAEMAAGMGMPALALTDHGVMFGVVPFYQAALRHGVRPIIGCECYLAPGSRLEKKVLRGVDPYTHLTILARNRAGYRNLMRLCTLGHTEGFYHRPRIDREILADHREGLIVLSGCLKGEISALLLEERLEEAAERVRFYRDLFGDDFYLEIQDNGLPEQKKVLPLFSRLSAETGAPMVATNDCHYLLRGDSEAHDALLCIQTASKLDDPARMRFSSDRFYFRSPVEMAEVFADYPEALANTVRIAEKCHVELEFGRTLLPEFRTPDGSSLSDHLALMARRGLAGRFGIDASAPSEEDRPVLERMERELGVINRMGYPGYFLILKDIVDFARDSGIAVGPGRGSAAGSLVAYLVGITDIDPLRYGLLFERFLNPDRVSMPDIDIDFEDARREEVISHIRGRYGSNQIAQIVTFGTLSARAVIRDVGRVMGLSYGEVDQLAKKVPEELHITIEDALRKEPELARRVKEEETVERLFRISTVLEGMARHASTHAAGIVIGPDDTLDHHTPLFLGTQDAVTTQYEMGALGELGLLKIDLLGLRTLTVIKKAAALVNERYGTDVSPSRLPLDDRVTFEMLSSGESSGIFQLESTGMRELLRKIRPDRFEDLIAILALYRPGPLGSGMVEDFVRGRKKPETVKYDHPILEKILEPTHGIILYQEQVMEIVHRMGGFTLAQSDLFRRAMGKKDPETMEKNRDHFLEGAKKNKVRERVAQKIFEHIIQFAGYGFNKSHSAGYALVCYQTAWLKANYPLEFMAALLTSEMGRTEKIVQYIEECGRMNIWVLPPCVEESREEFTVFGNDIRFGLAAVKNVGLSAIRSIVESRNSEGPFRSLFDFCRRVDLRLVNRRVLESLVKAGAFDVFGQARSRLMAQVPAVLDQAARDQAEKEIGQGSLFGEDAPGAGYGEPEGNGDLPEWTEPELLAGEKEVLGFYFSGHPFGRYEKLTSRLATHRVRDLDGLKSGSQVRLGGVVEKVKRLTTRASGRQMASFTFEDLSGKVTVMVFPELHDRCSNLLVEGEIIFLEGKTDLREDQAQVLASEILPVAAGLGRYAEKVVLDIHPAGLDEAVFLEIRETARKYPGNVPLHLRLVFDRRRSVEIKAGPRFGVLPDDTLVQALEKIPGIAGIDLRRAGNG